MSRLAEGGSGLVGEGSYGKRVTQSAISVTEAKWVWPEEV